MARCGCQGAGSTTCEAIVRCVADNLGPGIIFSQGDIQLGLSRDGGNCARFGSDGRLYVPCDGGGGGGGGGGKTVDGLPEFVHGGIGGGAGLVQAYAAPYAIDYAIANRVDVLNHQSWVTTDGVAVWSPFAPSREIDFWTTNPSTQPSFTLSSEMYNALWSDAGVPGGNPVGRNTKAPPEQKIPDGGWYGWCQPPFKPMLTSEVLERIRARCVVFLGNNAVTNIDTQANINAILAAQAQQWVVADIPVAGMAMGQIFIDAGIPHVCVSVHRDQVVTPQQCVDSGATWVRMFHDYQSNARITSFVDAGLHVILGYDARHATTQKAIALGCRGQFSNDFVYARGGVGQPWLDYRSTSMTFQGKQLETGMLTMRTDTGDILDNVGHPKKDEYGRFFEGNFGYTDGTVLSWQSQLLGKFCPLPDATQYTITQSVKVDEDTLPTGGAPKIGWIIAADTDIDPSQRVDDPPKDTRHGYACFIRVGDGPGSNGYMEIGVFNTSGEYTELAVSATAQPVAPQQWVDLEVEVAADTITLRRTDTGTTYEVSATNTDWRGGYVFHTWEEDSAAGTGSPFRHGYRDNILTSGDPTSTDWAVLEINFGTWGELEAAFGTWAEAQTGPLGSPAI